MSMNHRLAKRSWGDDWAVFEVAFQLRACPTCHAKKGTMCVRVNSFIKDPYLYAHKARRTDLDALWERGVRHGRSLNPKRIRKQPAPCGICGESYPHRHPNDSDQP